MNEEKTNQVVDEEDFFNMDESDFTDTPSEEEQIPNEENVEDMIPIYEYKYNN